MQTHVEQAIVKKDSDNDQRLTSNDIRTIGLSMPSGKGYKEILHGVDVFVGHRLQDENTLLLIYQRNGVGYSANVSLSGFILSNEEELPKVSP